MIQPNASLSGFGHEHDTRRRFFPCPQFFGPVTERPLSIDPSTVTLAKAEASAKLEVFYVDLPRGEVLRRPPSSIFHLLTPILVAP